MLHVNLAGADPLLNPFPYRIPFQGDRDRTRACARPLGPPRRLRAAAAHETAEVHPDLFKNATEPLHIHIEGKLKVTWTATLTKRRQRSIGLRGRIGPSPARNRPNSTVTTRNSYITTKKLGTLKKLPGYSGVSDFVNRTQEGLQR